jgi:hypothetical protein
MRRQLPDTDAQPVFLRSLITLQKALFFKRGQQAVHCTFMQANLGGDLCQAEVIIIILSESQQYIQRPFYGAYSQFPVFHLDLPFTCFTY